MWGFIVLAYNWIAGALATAATAIATTAWSAIVAIWNVLKSTGHVLSVFGHQAWGFLRDTWDKVLEPTFKKIFTATVTGFKDLWSKVLKPAWAKFNKWIDRAHDWLSTKFGPILCWLQRARDAITTFYKTYIRPWLDAIDITRQFLKLLEKFHVKWAFKLDRELGSIEDFVTSSVNYVIGKVNEITNIVNRVVTLDGLFQRVVLIRSLVRDYEFAWRAIVNPYSTPIADPERGALNDVRKSATATEVTDVVRPYLHLAGARDPELQAEIRVLWLTHLHR